MGDPDNYGASTKPWNDPPTPTHFWVKTHGFTSSGAGWAYADVLLGQHLLRVLARAASVAVTDRIQWARSQIAGPTPPTSAGHLSSAGTGHASSRYRFWNGRPRLSRDM